MMKLYSILLVDDEESILKSIKHSLTKKGYKVDATTNGEEAIAKLEEASYELVITDLIMPGITGMDVLKATRKINTDTVVIILTAHGTTASLMDAKQHGVADYILKPVNSADLHFRITTCLERYELQKQIKDLQAKLAAAEERIMQYEQKGRKPEDLSA